MLTDKTTEKPYTLATRYLMEQWKKRHGVMPPLDLAQSVVTVVNMTGFSKPIVDRLIASYEKQVLAKETSNVQQ